MRQIGIVTEHHQNTAVVEVRRMSACSGCHRADPGMDPAAGAELFDVSHCHECSMFPVDTELTVSAVNEIGAVTGERVVIESSTELILGYAAAVFLLPIGAAFLIGCLCALAIAAEWSAYLGAVIGFVGAFVAVKLLFDRRAKEKTVYTIIKRLTKGTNIPHECESMEN